MLSGVFNRRVGTPAQELVDVLGFTDITEETSQQTFHTRATQGPHVAVEMAPTYGTHVGHTFFATVAHVWPTCDRCLAHMWPTYGRQEAPM